MTYYKGEQVDSKSTEFARYNYKRNYVIGLNNQTFDHKIVCDLFPFPSILTFILGA